MHELAYNLWWSWNAEAQRLYQTIDAELWQRGQHNPVRLLREAAPERLQALAEDHAFLEQYDQVMATFDAYMKAEQTWFKQAHPELLDQTIAYFSMEFGLHESLPIYSGGLGILSGDHCKEASDLGLPLVASASSIRRAISASASTPMACKRPPITSCASRKFRPLRRDA